MEAAVNIIFNAIGKAKFSHLKLYNDMLKTYIEELMKANGNLHVCVRYGDQEYKLVLVVVQGDGPSLFGLKHDKLVQLSKMSNRKLLSMLSQQYQSLYAEGLGLVTSYSYKDTLHIQQDATSRSFKLCPIPLTSKIQLERTLSAGVMFLRFSQLKFYKH